MRRLAFSIFVLKSVIIRSCSSGHAFTAARCGGCCCGRDNDRLLPTFKAVKSWSL